MKGNILVFSAPSGSGKSTLIASLMQQVNNLHFSVSATSRAPRGEEQNGREYFFLTPEAFKQKINEGDFLEYEEVYPDRFYGTLRSEVERQTQAGENVVLDIDVKGAMNVKRIYGNEALLIFIQPPSIEVLRHRLIKRGTETQEAIADRIKRAEYELSFAPRFDHIIVNDILETAQQETVDIVKTFLDKN